MNVEIIENIEDFPQFEAHNVFQTVEWMRLFEGEDDTKVVFFAVYANAQCTMHNAQLDAIGDMDKSQLLLLQPVVIQRFVKWLPWRFGAYAVAWREPWRAENLSDDEAVEAFKLMNKEIVKYCRKRALYIEYRHFSENNIYALIFNSQFLTFNFPWYNIYRRFEAGDSVEREMNKSKRRQLKQSFEAGVWVELNPSEEDIWEWYRLLQRLYKRIHRPLPSVDVFLKLNKSGIGKVFVVKYQKRVVSGCAMLHYVNRPQSAVGSQLSIDNDFHIFRCARYFKTDGQYESQQSILSKSSEIADSEQFFYEWYRASIEDKIKGVYPSVVATWQELQSVVEVEGGIFDFMGAGPRNKPYGVRDFKLKFGGELTLEYRYRRFVI